MYDVIINVACELCCFVCCDTYQVWYRAARDCHNYNLTPLLAAEYVNSLVKNKVCVINSLFTTQIIRT
jgi:hypothetical protein